MKYYMFRTVPLSIIRSFSLYTQQWYMSYRFADSFRAGSGWDIKFIFGMKFYMFRTVPLSIIRSFSLTHRIGICHTGLLTVDRQLSANLYVLLCVQWKNPDDGQRNFPKYEEFHSKNKFEKLVHLVGFIVRNLLRCAVTWTSKMFVCSWPSSDAQFG